jgi:chorismate lyase / 3-hydroxybenzoate synthase
VSVARTPRAVAADVPLLFRRLRLGAATDDREDALGGRWLGDAQRAEHAPLLAPDGAVFDAWQSAAEPQRHRHGCVQYATDGHWLHGCAEIDDAALGLADAAQRAYADLFEVLAANDCPHLLRLWNYLADINGESGGVERYRQFNAGRQQAFLDAQRSAFEGSPAACALGTQRGPLRIHFLAGRAPPLAIENPRQVSAYRYPEAYGLRRPAFSRAALADVGGGRSALFISGTASIVGHATLHAGDVRRQTEESLANIEAVRELASLRAGLPFPASELICTVYLRHADDLGIVREVFERGVGPASSAARDAAYVQAHICRADLLVEIEAHGFAQQHGGAA